MATSTNLKFSLNAVLALCASFIALALVGIFWLSISTASTSGFQSYSPTDWQSSISATSDQQKLKAMCGSIAQLLEESSSVIEMQSAVTNKMITTLSLLAIAVGGVGTFIFASVFRNFAGQSKPMRSNPSVKRDYGTGVASPVSPFRAAAPYLQR